MKVRDIVKASESGNPLRCGSGVYDTAIVMSVKPLVLISKASCMKWENYEGKLEVINKANWFMFFRAWNRRLNVKQKIKVLKDLTKGY